MDKLLKSVRNRIKSGIRFWQSFLSNLFFINDMTNLALIYGQIAENYEKQTKSGLLSNFLSNLLLIGYMSNLALIFGQNAENFKVSLCGPARGAGGEGLVTKKKRTFSETRKINPPKNVAFKLEGTLNFFLRLP